MSPRTLPIVNWKTITARLKAANGSVSSGNERATRMATRTLLRLDAAWSARTRTRRRLWALGTPQLRAMLAATWSWTQAYVAARPFSSEIDGAHPSRSRMSVLSLLRPRTPCGASSL